MQPVQLLRAHGLFIALFIMVAVLRLIPLFDYQFTYDEITVLQRVDFGDLTSLVEGAIRIDAHPGLLQVIIYYIYQAAGPATWLIKLPFILMSLGGLVYAYMFGLRNFSRQAGIVAAIFLGFGLIYVYHASVARMYCSGIFFTLALLFHFGEYVFRKNRDRLHLIFMGLFMLLCALNHHINALYAATLYIGGFLLLERAAMRAYLVCGAATVLLYLPHLPVTLYQLSVGGIGADQGGWLEAPGIEVFPQLLNVICGSGWSLVIVLCLLVVSIIGGRQRGRWNRQLFLTALFLVNFLVVFLYSIWRAPIYQHTVMLFAGSGLLLALSSALDSRSRLVNQVILLLLSVWLISETYFRKDYLSQCVKTIYEYQFERTAYYKRVYGDAEVFPIFFEADSVMRRIYFAKYGLAYPCKINADSVVNHGSRASFDIGGDKVSPLLLFQRFISTLESDYLVLASAPPLQQALAKQYYPFLVEYRQTHAIHYKVYSKRASDKTRVVPDDKVMFDSASPAGATFSASSQLPPAGLPVMAENEYPYAVKGRYRSAAGREGQVILAAALLENDQPLSGVECCMSVTGEAHTDNLHYNAGSAREFLYNGKGQVLFADIFIGNFHRLTGENDHLNIYMWNHGGERFVLRDLTFKVIDHWPKRWQFWD